MIGSGRLFIRQMPELPNYSNCTGCGACISACGKMAIAMVPDKLGFLYPKVDVTLCLECGLCEKSCPVLLPGKECIPQKVLAVKSSDDSIRKSSSSGGVFSLIAEGVVSRGGVVYGAAFDDKFHVAHQRAATREEMSGFRGSKYVQSDTGTSFREVKRDLVSGREVLFSGTPCQVAGLKQYLRKNYDRLILLDFVCHGVPNPRIWHDFLSEETVDGDTIDDISFRDKSRGWIHFCFHLNKHNKSKTIIETTPIWEHKYMRLFLNNLILRESCFHCPFREGKSGADYTLGDFWGIEKVLPSFFDDDGISLVVERTRPMPQDVLENCMIEEAPYESALYYNVSLEKDWPHNPLQNLFYYLHDSLHLNLATSGSVAIAVHAAYSWLVRLKGRFKRISGI